jgi:predicted ATP-grasp superfamily ATP-dependent carboligase
MRRLARQGIEVHLLGGVNDPGRYSRFGHYVNLGSGNEVQGRWLDWLEREAPAGAVVITASDHGVELIARNRARLEALGLVPMELADDAALAMLDMESTYEIARRGGVPCPDTVAVPTWDDLAEAKARLRFPFALKPVHSYLFHGHFQDKILHVNDEEELDRIYGRTSELGLEMTATEVVMGPDAGICTYCGYFDENSKPLADFTKRRPRQFPAGQGTGTLHISDRLPEAFELGRRFGAAAGLKGFASIEFKEDARNGGLKLIECNYRFGATPNLTGSGFDVATFVYNRLTGRPLPDMDYRTGMRTINPLSDFRAFLQYRRRGEMTTAQYVRSLLHPHNFIVFEWSDPTPTLGYYLKRLVPGGGRR